MAAFSGSPAARPGDVTGTLRLLAYMALAIALIVLDHRGGWLVQLRTRGEMAVQPLWWLASLPARVGQGVRDDASTRASLADENRILRNALLISGARLSRLQAAAAENARLRGLLGAGQRGGLDVQLAPILNIDLDPTRQRLVLDAGSRDGVEVGQSVIDAGGLLGQIIAVEAGTATVLLITDPDHAVPVVVARTGVRLVAYGKGRSDRLELANIPLSSDIRIGDSIVTSGLGGRFPAGQVLPYVIAQVVGAVAAAALLYVIASGAAGRCTGSATDSVHPLIGPLEPGDERVHLRRRVALAEQHAHQGRPLQAHLLAHLAPHRGVVALGRLHQAAHLRRRRLRLEESTHGVAQLFLVV